MKPLTRLLSPVTNPNGWLTLLAAAWTITQAIHPMSARDNVLAGVIAAAAAFVSRAYVTPVKDPRDGNGNPLGPPTMRHLADAARAAGAQITWPVPSSFAPTQPVTATGSMSPSGVVQPPATTTGPAAPGTPAP